MESLQRSVKQTDAMLLAVVQQLGKQIETMGTSTSNANLARVAKKLELSLAKVQRVHRHLEYDLGKLAAIIEGSDAEQSGIEDSSDKESIDDESASRDMGGEKTPSRMETKLDSLTTKFEQVAGLQPLVLRSETKIDDVLRACKTADTSQASTLARLVAIESLLSQIKKRDGGSTYAGTAVTSTRLLVTAPPALSLPKLIQPGNKKRNIGFGDSDPMSPAPAQSSQGQLGELNNDQKNKLQELAKLRSLTEGILDRLVPCLDGRFWDANLVFERFRLFWDTETLSLQATRLTECMNAKESRGWFCVRRMAADGSNPVALDGRCRFCRNMCVQMRAVEADRENKENRYYVRVMQFRPREP